MLAAFALVLLVSSVTEGWIIDKCELKAKLDAAQFQQITLKNETITVNSLITRLVCKASSLAFNTSSVKNTRVHNNETKPSQTLPQDPMFGAQPRARRAPPQAPAGAPPKSPLSGAPPQAPAGAPPKSPLSGAPPQAAASQATPQALLVGTPPQAHRASPQAPSGAPPRARRSPPKSPPARAPPQASARAPPKSPPSGAPPQATPSQATPQALLFGAPPRARRAPPKSPPAGAPPQASARAPPKSPPSRPHESVSTTTKVVGHLYGVFELSDQVACNSGMMPSLNVCNMTCSAFIDEDITDDITCLKTLMNFMKAEPKEIPADVRKNVEMLVKKCSVSPDYFAECV
ncbi:uncharacterized protein [Garra rufa]|uniref:uncharacterized protein n=1 Tax=Garra rufa TaxID=137080 RepID=UPI003CCEF744